MINHPFTVGIATLVMATLIGCGSEPQEPAPTATRNIEPSTKTTADAQHDAPFQYKLVTKEEMMHSWGPQVVVNLETTNEVAKNATKDDLRKLWQQMAPTLGDRRVFLYLKTPVPGASPWAVMSRIKTDGEWKVDINIHEYGIDAEPYHFVNDIDRSMLNQSAMIVTLPMVNRVSEQLVRRGWTITQRQEAFFSAESKRGIQSVYVTLTPEGIDIDTFMAHGNAFPDTVAIVFAELSIADDLKNKLYSVIGSPEYLRAAPGEPARWSWTIDDIEVTYYRLPRIDDLSAGYAR